MGNQFNVRNISMNEASEICEQSKTKKLQSFAGATFLELTHSVMGDLIVVSTGADDVVLITK